MAASRDGDLLLWLHNKLGTSSDTWSEGSICSQLNIEVLRNIKECFVELQTQVKLKLLLSFFHIPKRNVEEWRRELEGIIQVAIGDSEPWVTMLAEIMKTFPSSGSLNLDIRKPIDNQHMTQDLLEDMRKLIKKFSGLGLLPMECNYLNRNAFLSAAGQQVPLTKHFALKRKPKAAALRVDLLNRSTDAQVNVKKNQLPSVPVRSRAAPRKSDTMPMRGIPSRALGSNIRTSGLSSTPMLSRSLVRSNLNRKDGGIKLLEINESPILNPQLKKRRKLQEIQESKMSLEAEKHIDTKPQIHGTSAKSKVSRTQVMPEPPHDMPPTPDYAAGLTPNPIGNPPTPSTPYMSLPSSPGGNLGPPSVRSQHSMQNERVLTQQGTPQMGVTQQRIILANPQGGSGQTILYRTINTAAPGGYTHGELVSATPVSLNQQESQGAQPGQPQYATLQPVQPDMMYTGMNLSTNNPSSSNMPQTQVIAIAPQGHSNTIPQAHQQPPVQMQHNVQNNVQPVQNAAQPPPRQQKHPLSLTKEQLLEAQEMFQASNKVTKPEKALILGFMAGSRDNPCPHLGSIVTIKLSEEEEMVQQPDGTLVKMLAETHFQMNYNLGEWHRIRKYIPIPMH